MLAKHCQTKYDISAWLVNIAHSIVKKWIFDFENAFISQWTLLLVQYSSSNVSPTSGFHIWSAISILFIQRFLNNWILYLKCGFGWSLKYPFTAAITYSFHPNHVSNYKFLKIYEWTKPSRSQIWQIMRMFQQFKSFNFPIAKVPLLSGCTVQVKEDFSLANQAFSPLLLPSSWSRRCAEFPINCLTLRQVIN